MSKSSHQARVLLIESGHSISTKVENMLLEPPTSKLYSTTMVPHLREAFQHLNNHHFDLILLDLDPEEDPDLSQLKRLHEQVPHLPIVALMKGQHEPVTLKVLQSGAQGYLLESQLSKDMLPTFLLRTIERAAHQQALKVSEEHFRLLIENSSDVILILQESGLISFAGPSTKRILNIESYELNEKNLLDFIHRDDRESFLSAFEEAFHENESLHVQFRFRLDQGQFLHMEGRGRVTLNPEHHRVCILNAHDISHRIELEEELRTLSFRDELTGLHNRRSFVSLFEQQLKIARRTNKKGFHLLFIDLDGFKWINDNLGHKVGDHALVHASNLLKQTFRDADVIARLGGDEFVVLLTDGSEADHIDLLKNRIHESVHSWNREEERAYQLAMSVGAVHHDFSHPRPADEILREADALMYEQKKNKKRGAPPPSTSISPSETTTPSHN